MLCDRRAKNRAPAKGGETMSLSPAAITKLLKEFKQLQQEPIDGVKVTVPPRMCLCGVP